MVRIEYVRDGFATRHASKRPEIGAVVAGRT
jgi:hypothetical protein